MFDMFRPYLKTRGFTLIELLIVVAIIAILAAIAVPNFMEAQVRAKVSKVKADLRTIGGALEAYFVDFNNFPEGHAWGSAGWYMQYVTELSTPIAYMANTNLVDPFAPPPSMFAQSVAAEWKSTYQYIDYCGSWGRSQASAYWGSQYGQWTPKIYVVSSYGPDRVQDNIAWYPFWITHLDWRDPSRPSTSDHALSYTHPIEMLYDPTNGTKSWGDIGRTGGQAQCEPQIGG